MPFALIVALVLQVLSAPDPAQMEHAPDLGYRPVEHGLTLPDAVKMGPPSSVGFDSHGHLWVFNRGPAPLMEFDASGRLLRSLGEGLYGRPHGMTIDAEDNIWTTDVTQHTVTKMNAKGEVLMVLGTRGQPGNWNEASGTRLLNEPNALTIGPNGDIFLVQGHGKADPRVLRFDRTGKLITAWGELGKGPGQFDLPHSIVIDAKNQVYVADRQNRRVQIFDRDGTYLREWKFAGLPCGFFLGRDGQMYLTSGFSGEILRLDANGKALAGTGQQGKALGEFGEAHYMTIAPNGDIFVADTVKPALHKFVRK